MAGSVAETMTPPFGSDTTPEMLPVIPDQASAAPKRIATIKTGINLNKNRIELSPSRSHSPLGTISTRVAVERRAGIAAHGTATFVIPRALLKPHKLDGNCGTSACLEPRRCANPPLHEIYSSPARLPC